MITNPIGQVLRNQFRVDAFIASGGMGAVYRVWDIKRNVHLAMKTLHEDLAEDPSIYKKFKREARALKKLAHPNIVPFYGLYKTRNLAFLLESYVDGPSLKQILRERKARPITVSDALIYLKALSSALGYAHVHEVVHCDVKPGNVMVDQGGRIYLTDFGVARHAESTVTTLGFAGTAAYMAPEQCRGEAVSPQTDIYAMGVMLFEVLTGRRPFRGDEKGTEESGSTSAERMRYAHLHLPPPDPREFNGDLVEALSDVILKALEKKPEKRFTSTREFYEQVCYAVGIGPDIVPDRVASTIETEPLPVFQEKERAIPNIVIIAGVVLALAIVSAMSPVMAFLLGTMVGLGVLTGSVASTAIFSDVIMDAYSKLPSKEAAYIQKVLDRYFEPQPSYLTYAFGGGWQVLKYLKDHVFSETSDHWNWWFEQGEPWKVKAEETINSITKYASWLFFGGFQLVGYAQHLSAMVFVALFFSLQLFIFAVWVLLSMMIVGFLSAVNFIFGIYHKIFCRCPDCHAEMVIPVYQCPTCGTEHTRLWPSIYGIFHHRCVNCETDLPTLDLVGPMGLDQVCAACGRPMDKESVRLRNTHIPIIGGPQVGKSTYLFSAIKEFVEDYAPKHGYVVEFRDDGQEEEYQETIESLLSGNALSETSNSIPRAYNLSAKKTRGLFKNVLYLYDAAGKAYGDNGNARQDKYFHYVHGVIFVIDPLSIDHFIRDHEDEMDEVRDELKPSPTGVMEIYENMVAILERDVGLQSGQKWELPIAVVLSKTDALGLDQTIGHAAVEELMEQDPSIHFETDAMNVVIEEFLEGNQLGEFVEDVKAQFGNVSFFSCSTLGGLNDTEDENQYQPLGVLDSLLWLLGETKAVNLVPERARKMDSIHNSMASTHGNIFKKVKFYYWDSLKPTEEVSK